MKLTLFASAFAAFEGVAALSLMYFSTFSYDTRTAKQDVLELHGLFEKISL